MGTKPTLNWNATYHFLLTEHRHLIKSSAVHETWLMSIIRLESLLLKLSHREAMWLAQVTQLLNGWAMMGNSLFALNSKCWASSLLYIRIRIILLLPPLFPPSSLFFVSVLHFLCVYIRAQLCLSLCNHMGYSPPGSSVHGISQTRILEWLAVSFSRRSSWPRDWTQVSCIAGSLLYFSWILYQLSHQGNPFYFLL